MALTKSIASGKEHRKLAERRSARLCGCVASRRCPYCRNNRTIGNRRRAEAAADLMREE